MLSYDIVINIYFKLQNNMNNLSFFIAKKYSLSKVICYVAIIALTMGIACILTVASVMNGFYDILDKKLSNIISNVIIFNVDNNLYNELLSLQKQKDSGFNNIKDIEKILQTQAFFTNNNKIDYLAVQNSSKNTKNKYEDNNSGITISKQYAKDSNLKVNQDITLLFNNKENKLEQLPIKIKNINYETVQVLNQIAYISRQDPNFSKIFNNNINYSTNLQIKLDNPHNANNFKIKLLDKFKDHNPKLVIYTWEEIFGSILDGIKYTKQIMFIILFFMIIVATFNILATITITIKEKQGEIAILQTIGATKPFIFKIFISQSMIFSTIALTSGIILSYILCLFISDITKFIESIFNIILINPDNYLIDYLPTKYSLIDVLYISIFTYLINIIIAIIPAYKATKTNPVQLLRYE